jgi:2-keto-4-pentenoate hydratase/2-oxohepta-3-ene-1,7-dioic acid hydratase in catechol pathway
MILMSQRYVRVKNLQQQPAYGLLQYDRTVELYDRAPWEQGQLTGVSLALGEYELLAPCVPSKIVATGLNYAKHIDEMQMATPQEPVVSLKAPSAVIADQQAIVYPPQSQRVEYEGELALVIGAVTRRCDHQTAERNIWGYTIANDVTARDLQHQDSQWVRSKGFDTFCPLGPWIVRELGAAAVLQTYLNEELMQDCPLSDMIFDPAHLVAYVSQIMTLWPGDVILTGTPSGIGQMQVGDRVRVSIEGIGSLENPIVKPELA